MHAYRVKDWFPFSWTEVEVAMLICGIAMGGSTLLGFTEVETALFGLLVATEAYLAGLFVYAARHQQSELKFLENGALGGAGYVSYFRKAQRSLLLMHIDDVDTCQASC